MQPIKTGHIVHHLDTNATLITGMAYLLLQVPVATKVLR